MKKHLEGLWSGWTYLYAFVASFEFVCMYLHGGCVHNHGLGALYFGCAAAAAALLTDWKWSPKCGA